jgi:tetratricopeptide (TPR) repeat protein
MELGRPVEAHTTCRRGIELFPQDAELRFREGVVLHKLGRLEEATAAYGAVLANHEERHFTSVDLGLTGFKARQNLAVVFTEMGNLERAEAEWRAVVREMPRYRPGWRGLREVLLTRGRQQEALDLAENCLADPALQVEGRLLKSRMAVLTGDWEGALAELAQAVAQAPGDREAMQAQCELLFDHGAPAAAEQALRSLIGRDPSDAASHQNLGTLLLRLKRYDEAAREYRQALRLRADAPATHLLLGYALKESGRLAEAVAAWEEVLRLAPENAAARAELKRALQQGDGTLVPRSPT